MYAPNQLLDELLLPSSAGDRFQVQEQSKEVIEKLDVPFAPCAWHSSDEMVNGVDE